MQPSPSAATSTAWITRPPWPPAVRDVCSTSLPPRLGGLSAGSPVFFREVEVGKVLDWKLTGMAESVTLNVFVDAPYDQWVHDDSRFWNTSGVTLKLGAAGAQLQVNSLKAAFLGGITFETPPGDAPPERGRTILPALRHRGDGQRDDGPQPLRPRHLPDGIG